MLIKDSHFPKTAPVWFFPDKGNTTTAVTRAAAWGPHGPTGPCSSPILFFLFSQISVLGLLALSFSTQAGKLQLRGMGKGLPVAERASLWPWNLHTLSLEPWKTAPLLLTTPPSSCLNHAPAMMWVAWNSTVLETPPLFSLTIILSTPFSIPSRSCPDLIPFNYMCTCTHTHTHIYVYRDI